MTKRLRTRLALGAQRGQMLAIMAVSVAALVAMSAFVLDVGSWFRAHRSTQSVADASALAGAQALPYDTSQASALALQYASSNGGGVSAGDISYSSNTFANDTIGVTARRTAPGFFAKVFGLDSIDVSAPAQARAYNIAKAQYVAPFAVEHSHKDLSGPGCPCYGNSTTLDLFKTGPGNFKIIDLDGSGGTTGTSTLADWILNGYDGLLGLGWYNGDTGAKFNSSQVSSALDARIASNLLFPVYENTQGSGSGFVYEVVGWAGFHLTGHQEKGSCNKNNECTLSGYFTHVVWAGVESTSSENFFGATIVKLTG